ncbi:MAG TPA: hypothetical protein PKC13_33680 [Blastocatellia bacterium]|nr:hypothetical protein [Blastocatellia bacterium]HMY75439.1 hypothetical protein [Blastocatellia bacterium]
MTSVTAMPGKLIACRASVKSSSKRHQEKEFLPRSRTKEHEAKTQCSESASKIDGTGCWLVLELILKSLALPCLKNFVSSSCCFVDKYFPERHVFRAAIRTGI